MNRRSLLGFLLLVVAAGGACGNRSDPAPAARAPGTCVTATDCPAGQACQQGRCMTNLTEAHESVEAARRARQQVEDWQRRIDEQRDRAIENAGRVP